MATKETTKQGAAGLSDEQLREVLYYLMLCRYFDERMEAMYRQGRLPGAIYSGRGQEGTHVGSVYALQPEDALLTTHRDLSAQLTKGMDIKRTMAQFWGKIDGYTRGRDGNSHIGDWSGAKTFAVVSMLPDAYPVASGVALAFKRKGEPHVALAICGEGATSNGRWHEALNVSAIHRLPAVWIVNNNQWAYSTPNQLEFPVPTVAERGGAYGMPGKRVDGSDVLEVYAAVKEAVERARNGDGPSLIESVSLRWRGHAGHDAAKYVPPNLLDEHIQNKDPLQRFRERMLSDGVVDDAAIIEIQERIEREFQEGYEFAQSSPFPVSEDLTKGIFTDDGYWASEPSREGGTG